MAISAKQVHIYRKLKMGMIIEEELVILAKLQKRLLNFNALVENILGGILPIDTLDGEYNDLKESLTEITKKINDTAGN